MGNLSSESKQFVEDYLQALSGRPKTTEVVGQFVADPSLAEHIHQVEAAFPSYELMAEQLVAEGDLVAMRASCVACSEAPSPVSSQQGSRLRRS